MLPMGLGYVEGVTHDYVRHGIPTTLFAALDIASGTVLTECKARQRQQSFWSCSNASIRLCRKQPSLPPQSWQANGMLP